MAMTPEERKRIANARSPLYPTSTPSKTEAVVDKVMTGPKKLVDTARAALPVMAKTALTVPRAIGSAATALVKRPMEDYKAMNAVRADAEINSLKGTVDPYNSYVGGKPMAVRPATALPVQASPLVSPSAQGKTLTQRVADRAVNSGIGAKLAAAQQGLAAPAVPLESLRPAAAGSGAIRVSSTGETATFNGDGGVESKFDADGKAIKDIRKFTTLSSPRNEQRKMTARQAIGNLDVTFAPETNQEARAAFSQNPVRPTAQINRFLENQEAGLTQGQRASMNADRITSPEKYKPKSLGWKHQMALDEQNLRNQQAERNNAAQALITKDQLAEARDRTQVERDKMTADLPLNQARAEEAKANAKATGLTVKDAERIDSLNTILANPNTKPAEFNRARKALLAMKAKNDIVQRPTVLPGQKVSKLVDGVMQDSVTPPMIVDPQTGTSRVVTEAPPVMPQAEAEAMLKAAEGTPNYEAILEYYNQTYGE